MPKPPPVAVVAPGDCEIHPKVFGYDVVRGQYNSTVKATAVP